MALVASTQEAGEAAVLPAAPLRLQPRRSSLSEEVRVDLLHRQPVGLLLLQHFRLLRGGPGQAACLGGVRPCVDGARRAA